MMQKPATHLSKMTSSRGGIYSEDQLLHIPNVRNTWLQIPSYPGIDDMKGKNKRRKCKQIPTHISRKEKQNAQGV
jgi:hypothetical protein